MIPNPKSEWSFESAPAPYILRAAEKDDYYMRHVAEDVEDMLTRLLGTRWVNGYEKELKLSSGVAYYFLATSGGRQTLGEEYCDLMQIHSTRMEPQSGSSRALQILLFCTIPYIIEKWVPKGLTYLRDNSDRMGSLRNFALNVHHRQLQLKTTIRELLRFHLAVFFLYGEYYYISYRVAKSKMLLMNKPMPGTSSYTMIGWMIIIQQFVEGIKVVRSILKKRRGGAGPGRTLGEAPVQQDTADDTQEEDDDDTEGLAGRCSLCLGMRDRHNGPTTATICGHLFCWDCVTGLCRSSPSALCPLCRERITLQTLAPVYRYKSH